MLSFSSVGRAVDIHIALACAILCSRIGKSVLLAVESPGEGSRHFGAILFQPSSSALSVANARSRTAQSSLSEKYWAGSDLHEVANCMPHSANGSGALPASGP